MQLDAAALRDRGNTRGQAARKAGENQLDRRRRVIFGRKHLRVIGLNLEGLVAGLLATQSEEIGDDCAGVRSVHPFAGGSPLELRGLRRLFQRLACAQQRVDVDAVVDCGGGRIALRHAHAALLWFEPVSLGQRPWGLGSSARKIIHRVKSIL